MRAGWIRFTTVLCLVGLSSLLLWLKTGYADVPASATTIETQDVTFVGHPVGVVIMNEPCVYGENYHYKITANGELRTEGPLVCGQWHNSTGGEHICTLNVKMTCQSTSGANGSDLISYAVSENGVTAGNYKLSPWADRKQAVALFPAIKAHAEEGCMSILFWQAKRQEHNKPAPSPSKAEAEADCKPVLDQLCASAKNGSVKLATGADISILCHPESQ